MAASRVDLVRTLLHGVAAPVAAPADGSFAAALASTLGGTWDTWADTSSYGLVSIHIAGPKGTAVIRGSWLDTLDLELWEAKQIEAARNLI